LARDGLIARVGTLPAVNAAPVQGALHLAYSNYHLTNPVARASATMAACVSSLIVVQEAAE
jgi:NADH-quinone oxidoreductase subunit G